MRVFQLLRLRNRLLSRKGFAPDLFRLLLTTDSEVVQGEIEHRWMLELRVFDGALRMRRGVDLYLARHCRSNDAGINSALNAGYIQARLGKRLARLGKLKRPAADGLPLVRIPWQLGLTRKMTHIPIV